MTIPDLENSMCSGQMTQSSPIRCSQCGQSQPDSETWAKHRPDCDARRYLILHGLPMPPLVETQQIERDWREKAGQ